MNADGQNGFTLTQTVTNTDVEALTVTSGGGAGGAGGSGGVDATGGSGTHTNPGSGFVGHAGV